jgi:hypothetical protein
MKQNIWIFDMLLQYWSAILSGKVNALTEPGAK